MSGVTGVSHQGQPDTSSSLLGQKRPHDYAQQLKGLPTSDEEHEHNEATSPALKKQKTINPDSGNDSDLDDGEIVESSPGPSPAGLAVDLINQATAGAVTHEPSEDGEIDTTISEAQGPNIMKNSSNDTSEGQPMQHLGWSQGVSLGARASFGKRTTQLFPTNTSTKSEPVPVFISSQRGYEDGDNDNDNGDAKGELEDDDDEMQQDSPARDQAPQVPTERLDDSKTEPSPTFNVGNDTWNFPRSRFKIKKGAESVSGYWVERLRQWIGLFIQENTSMIDRLTTDVVLEGFRKHLIRPIVSLINGNKRRRETGRASAEKALPTIDVESLISKALSKFREQESKAAEDKESENKPVEVKLAETKTAEHNVTCDYIPLTSEREYKQDLRKVPKIPVRRTSVPKGHIQRREPPGGNDELVQQRKFFPDAEDPSRYCLYCSGIGHRARDCPELICRYCGSQEHSRLTCPSKQRCSKCRQLGHHVSTCNEKLALTSEEQGGCAFCSAEHAEERCTERWRTFKLIAEIHQKVKDISVFCYTCGANGHYGPECGLPDRGGKVTGWTPWSQANRLQYVDENSQDTAIAWEPSQAHNGDFHILGRAKRQVHTHFVSDDESEEDLVHPPVGRPAPRGEIRISSNIGSVVQGNNRGQARRGNGGKRRNGGDVPARSQAGNAQGNGSSFQPPLPPGPPPPLPRTEFHRSLAPPPPGSLPPRPQSFNFGAGGDGMSDRASQDNQSGRGGRGRSRGSRGGSRGRGRGRGRGRS